LSLFWVCLGFIWGLFTFLQSYYSTSI